ncbi:MAG TPA: response regulator [Planctomycetaceae bacterium]|jgi:two-component system KDP operon response regulator KdpE
MSSEPSVLIIEDEPQIRRFLRVSLECQGYHLIEAQSVREGTLQATQAHPDIVILDLGLPDLDGMEFLTRLREWSQMPVIVLSARGREEDKVVALDAGANDYLTKPFGVNELLARLRVLLRGEARSAADSPIYEVGELRVDLSSRQVIVRGEQLHLTPTQYRLLTTMIKHAGKVLTHRQLLKEVWGPHSVREHQYLRVYVGQIRQKIESDPTRPRYLLTESGVGYRFAAE